MRYPKSPIKEAIFEFIVKDLAIDSPEQLRTFHQVFNGFYRPYRIIRDFNGEIDFDDNTYKEKEASKIRGYIFQNVDQTKFVQVRTDGLSFHVLDSYNNWDAHFPEFWTLWVYYKDLFKPKQMLTIGVRFLNRIELKVPFKDFATYFNYFPPIPSPLPAKLNNFFMQVVVPHSDSLKLVTITEALDKLVEDSTGQRLPFLINIDVKQAAFPEKDDAALMRYFDEIRALKNEIFENCITDDARDLFK